MATQHFMSVMIIKLWPSTLVRIGIDMKLRRIELVRSCKARYKSKYSCKSFKLLLGRFLYDLFKPKSGLMMI